MKVIYSKDCEAYKQDDHPESPERTKQTHKFLKDKFDFIKPRSAPYEDILAVHTKQLLEKVRKGDFFDPDTPAYPKIFKHALISAGAATQAAELALQGESAFSLMRPPGHHATRDYLGGFCYFNNIAIAVSKVMEKIDKAVIIDFDVHHGNGTQDIFMGNKKVLYISLHEMFLYPGTGLISDKNCHNYPIKPDTDEFVYMNTFKKAMIDAENFKPNLIAVSAGFDAYKGDELSSINLEQETYAKIGKMISDLRKPTFAVLEGGYSEDLPQCILHFLNSF